MSSIEYNQKLLETYTNILRDSAKCSLLHRSFPRFPGEFCIRLRRMNDECSVHPIIFNAGCKITRTNYESHIFVDLESGVAELNNFKHHGLYNFKAGNGIRHSGYLENLIQLDPVGGGPHKGLSYDSWFVLDVDMYLGENRIAQISSNLSRDVSDTLDGQVLYNPMGWDIIPYELNKIFIDPLGEHKSRLDTIVGGITKPWSEVLPGEIFAYIKAAPETPRFGSSIIGNGNGRNILVLGMRLVPSSNEIIIIGFVRKKHHMLHFVAHPHLGIRGGIVAEALDPIRVIPLSYDFFLDGHRVGTVSN